MSDHIDEPPISPPWPILGPVEQDRFCGRCGDVIPADWRHYMRACSCTYEPRDRPPHAPDPTCETCAGCGFLPCQPQDMSVLQVSGRCMTCQQPAFYLIAKAHGWAMVPDSNRHYDAEPDDGHAAAYGPAPMVDAIAEHLEREAGR